MKKSSKLLLVALFFSIVLIITVLSVNIFAEDKDISRPGTTSKVTLESVDILESIGITVSDAERGYLAVYGEDTVSYGSHIPTSNISLNYNAESMALEVKAQVYEYSLSSGATVSWIPMTAIMGEESFALSLNDRGEYIAAFDGVEESEDLYVRVIYKTDVELSTEFINTLLNKAYSDAILWDKYKTYLDSLDKYEADKIVYQNYLVSKRVYDEKLATYKVYLDELSVYEAKKAEYDAYVEAMKVYNAEYEKYLQYLEQKKVYDEKLRLYNIYVENLETAKNQLATFEATRLPGTSQLRSVYAAIHGNLVKLVMENKDLIANEFVGASGDAVDDAGDSTEALKVIYQEYYSCSTEEEKYTYYAINYQLIKENFIKLFNALDKLYRNAKVRIAIEEQGYKAKFEIFLAQLYYTVNALSDEPVWNFEGDAQYDGNYRINRKTPLSIHEGKAYIIDTGAAVPLSSGYPAYREKPTITVYPEPQKPNQKLEPVAPVAVENPGDAPLAVAKPVAPSFMSAPFNLGHGEEIPSEALAIVEQYRAGTLAKRPLRDASEKLTFEIYVNKKVFNAKEIVVTFCDANGDFIHSTVAEQGSYAEFIGASPKKAETKRAAYVFSGWMDAHGKIVDITSMKSDTDITLYPHFEEKLKSYEVVWELDDRVVVTNATWGEIPSLGYVPVRPDTDKYRYVFSGWNKEPAPVVGDAQTDRYFANFDREYIVPVLNGGKPIGGATVSENNGEWFVDCTPGSVGANYTRLRVDLSYLLTRVQEFSSFSVLTHSYVAKFSYSDAILMQKSNARYFELATSTSQNRLTFIPRLLNGSGSGIDAEIPVALEFKGFLFSEPDITRIYRVYNGTRDYVNGSINEDSLALVAPCGSTYFAVAEYEAHILSTGPVELQIVGRPNMPHGESFEIRYTVPPGVRLNAVYMLDRYGMRTEITENKIDMPEGGCRIGVDYEYIEYTVNFISSGKIIGTRVYKYGEIPEMLSNPIRTADGVFKYTFDRWRNSTTGTSEITPVTSNVNYEALYLKEKIPAKEPTGGLQISDSVLQKLSTVAVYAGFVLLVFIPCAIIAITKFSIRMGRKASKKARKKYR